MYLQNKRQSLNKRESMWTIALIAALLITSVDGKVTVSGDDTKYDHNQLLRRLRFTHTDQLIIDEEYIPKNTEALRQCLDNINTAVQHIYVVTTSLDETTTTDVQNFQQILTQIVQPYEDGGLCFIKKDAIIDFMPMFLRHFVTAQSIIACEDLATQPKACDIAVSRRVAAQHEKQQRQEIRRQLHIIRTNMNAIKRIQNKYR